MKCMECNKDLSIRRDRDEVTGESMKSYYCKDCDYNG